MSERWPRIGLAVLLLCTAVLYLWNLSVGGFGNTYYAAAAQAGAQSWSAGFFSALDARGFITVDKPPLALWITELSVRVFGMNSLAVLVPEVVMGVGAVAMLFAAVRRSVPDPTQGVVAGLIAGGILAFTPVATLMFRLNNPDALLVLLLTVAAYCATRAVQAASWRWLSLVGAVVGAAFLTKMLQGFLVLPGIAAAYLLFAQTSWRRRLLHIGTATAALVASSGWWVLVVALTPEQSRPYIGGSTDNSVLDLAFGYNGLNRFFGAEPAVASSLAVPTIRPGHGATALLRIFSSVMAVDISWLVPVALFVIVFGAYSLARGRLDIGERSALVMWSGWLLVTAAVLSFMSGVVHPYYTVTLAPAVGALVGLGSVWAWRDRSKLDGRVGLACMLALGGAWSAVLLQDNRFGPHWLPRSVAIVCVVAAVAVLTGHRWLTAAGVAVGAVAAVVGTVAMSVAVVAWPGHGAVPIAYGRTGGGPDARAIGQLLAATNTPWSAATSGSQSAANLEIASGTSVMAIGGWSGGDPVPTLDEFIEYVRAGKIAYYVAAGAAQPHGPVIRSVNHGPSHTREIADWVAAHYPAVTMGQSLVYRLN